MSPSPWRVNTAASTLDPLDPGGHRRRPTVQTLQEIDVGQAHDVGVAAVADHADGPVGEIELGDDLEQEPPGHGWPQPGQR